MPAIDQSILDQGMVLLYFRPNGTTGIWYPLPYSDAVTQISLLSVAVGKVTVKASPSQVALDFKIVVVPGTSVTQLNVSHPHLNFKNYSQVASALNLKN